MSELRRGDDPPRESGQYVIETKWHPPHLVDVDVSGGCVWVGKTGGRFQRWNCMSITSYRKFDPVSYLEGATP